MDRYGMVCILYRNNHWTIFLTFELITPCYGLVHPVLGTGQYGAYNDLKTSFIPIPTWNGMVWYALHWVVRGGMVVHGCTMDHNVKHLKCWKQTNKKRYIISYPFIIVIKQMFSNKKIMHGWTYKLKDNYVDHELDNVKQTYMNQM